MHINASDKIYNSNIFERCKIPECDSTPHDDYLPKWTRFAIPHSHNVPAKCLRYESIPIDAHATSKANHCDEMLFNDSYPVSCTEFIYGTDEVTVLKEVSSMDLYFRKKKIVNMKSILV